MIEFIWRSDGNIMDELSKFPYSVWLLRVLCFGYYYHKISTAVYPVQRYFFTVNTVDEILSTAHPYYKRGRGTFDTLWFDLDSAARSLLAR